MAEWLKMYQNRLAAGRNPDLLGKLLSAPADPVTRLRNGHLAPRGGIVGKGIKRKREIQKVRRKN